MALSAHGATVSAAAPDRNVRADIEGLRAVAVALVLGYHYFPLLVPGGYIGVDVFFVISGYLITRSLVDARPGAASFGRWLLDFWARRFRRLLPNALTVLVFVSLAGVLLLSGFSIKRLGSDVFWAALYSANWLFVLRSIDYLAWDETQRSLLLNFWSLAVEEQFYLTWPLLLGVLLLPARQGRGVAKFALPVVLLALTASMAYMIWQSARNQTFAFFATPGRAWELLAGAVLTLAPVASRMARLPTAARAAGLLMIGASALLFDEDTAHPGWITTLPVVGALLLVALPAPDRRESMADRVLGWRPMQWLGARSYSIYLWHWPILVLGTRVWPGADSWRLPALLALSLMLAELAYRGIENPCRHRWGRGLKSSRVVALALACSLGMACVGFALRAAASNDLRELLGQNAAPGSLALPSIDSVSADLPEVYRNGCHLPLGTTVSPPCVFGRVDATETIVLLGDSHAAQWFSALDAAARKSDLRLLSLTKSSCPSVDVAMWNGVARSLFTACDEWREHTLQRIETLKPRWVILSNLVEAAPIVADRGRAHPMRGREAVQAWTEGLERVIARLQRAGIGVVVLRDIPRPRPDVLDCLYAAERAERCELTRSEALATPALDLLAAAHAGVMVWDFTNDVCHDGRCRVLLPDGPVVVYRDSNHLTDSFVRTLEPVLTQALRTLDRGGAPAVHGR